MQSTRPVILCALGASSTVLLSVASYNGSIVRASSPSLAQSLLSPPLSLSPLILTHLVSSHRSPHHFTLTIAQRIFMSAKSYRHHPPTEQQGLLFTTVVVVVTVAVIGSFAARSILTESFLVVASFLVLACILVRRVCLYNL
ncbi:hypothetical protein C8Q77DRAFT_582715 [Trametes polyzona]|nr:hypothetical protein C8Q77DRAFT_582715 [Trametes polyzona]